MNGYRLIDPQAIRAKCSNIAHLMEDSYSILIEVSKARIFLPFFLPEPIITKSIRNWKGFLPRYMEIPLFPNSSN